MNSLPLLTLRTEICMISGINKILQKLHKLIANHGMGVNKSFCYSFNIIILLVHDIEEAAKLVSYEFYINL
jgi:hypothetical protein